MERPCNMCGRAYTAQRSTSKFCSTGCRVRSAQRRSGASVVELRPAPADEAPLGRTGRAIMAELEELGKAESGLGAQALELASRLDAGRTESGASLASVSRELRAVMAEARITAKPASAIDELRRKRDAGRAHTA